MDTSKKLPNTLYQTSLACAMEIGLFDAACDYHTIMQKGDTGLGTFEHFDGEMVAIEGIYYQIKSNGKVNIVQPNQQAPFVQVANFRPTDFFSVGSILGFTKLNALLESKFENKNVPYVISIKTICSELKIRSVCKKQKPYPAIVDAIKDQVIFDLTRTEGTMVGFWFPAYLTTLTAPGLHLHYMSSDKTAGGHVLDLEMDAGEVSFAAINNIEIMLPSSKAFAEAPLKSTQINMEKLQKVALQIDEN